MGGGGLGAVAGLACLAAVAAGARRVRLVEGGGQRPDRLGQLIDRGRRAQRALARGRACSAARGGPRRGVAYGVVEVGLCARVAVDDLTGCPAPWGQARGLASVDQRVVEDLDRPFRAARGEQPLSARSSSPEASAAATSSSVRPRSPKTRWAARLTSRDGLGGNTSELTTSATPPPRSASTIRVGRRPAAGRLERDEQQRRDRGLGDQQLAAAEHERDAHGEDDHEAGLQRPGADRLDDEVGGGQPETDACGQLDGAPPTPAMGCADRDDRCDRGEDRPRVVQREQQCEVVGADGGERRLQDPHRARSRPQEAHARRMAAKERGNGHIHVIVRR